MNVPCIRCSAALPADWPPSRPCPRCLLRLGLADEAEGAAAASPSPPAGRDRPSALGEAPSAEELDAHFPELEVLELLGEGGMGAVYRARQVELDRTVALKVLRPRVDPDGELAERFLREARSLAQLKHPRIVSVYDFGRVQDRLYLVMELVEGASLRALLHGGELTPERCLDIVVQMCSALQAAHEHGVVHRDIKPENVLVDRRGDVKLVDFGLAKVACGPDALRLTLSGQAMGTPQYMAPEQIERPLSVDHRADLYAMGVLIYELFTGELPLGRFAPASSKVGVDPRWDAIVDRALEKEPDRRYQSAAELESNVEAIRSGPPPLPGTGTDGGASRWSGPPLDAPASAAPAKGRSRWVKGCVVALLLGALLLVPAACLVYFTAVSRIEAPAPVTEPPAPGSPDGATAPVREGR